jgi:hypothetical protein
MTELDDVADYVAKAQTLTYQILERMARNADGLVEAQREVRLHRQRLAEARRLLSRLDRRDASSD